MFFLCFLVKISSPPAVVSTANGQHLGKNLKDYAKSNTDLVAFDQKKQVREIRGA
jgi:hypothetical protein